MRRQNTQGYVPPEAIEKARSVDLLTYLKTYEPYCSLATLNARISLWSAIV